MRWLNWVNNIVRYSLWGFGNDDLKDFHVTVDGRKIQRRIQFQPRTASGWTGPSAWRSTRLHHTTSEIYITIRIRIQIFSKCLHTQCRLTQDWQIRVQCDSVMPLGDWSLACEWWMMRRANLNCRRGCPGMRKESFWWVSCFNSKKFQKTWQVHSLCSLLYIERWPRYGDGHNIIIVWLKDPRYLLFYHSIKW